MRQKKLKIHNNNGAHKPDFKIRNGCCNLGKTLSKFTDFLHYHSKQAELRVL